MKQEKDQFFNINKIKQTPFFINSINNFDKPDEKKQQQLRSNSFQQKQKKTVRGYRQLQQNKQKQQQIQQKHELFSLQPQFHCIYNSFPCRFICTNPSCPYPALICSNIYCKCQSEHPSCLLCEPNRLINKLRQKINKNKVNNKLIQTFDKIIDDAIDWLSELKENVKTNQLKMYGLNEKQKIVWKKMNKCYSNINGDMIRLNNVNNINNINDNNINGNNRNNRNDNNNNTHNNVNNIQIQQDALRLTGRQISQILAEINEQSLCVDSKQLEEQLLILWGHQIWPQFYSLLNKIPQMISNSNNLLSTCLLFKQSSIVRSYELESKIIRLFDSNINGDSNNNLCPSSNDNSNNHPNSYSYPNSDTKSYPNSDTKSYPNSYTNNLTNRVSQVQLLYRSGQNNNSIQMFYEKCSQIPSTIILIKTIDKRIFGGYTTLTWKKKNNNTNNTNNKYKTKKYILKPQHIKSSIISISYRPSWGPAFGQANRPDFLLINKANLPQNYIHKHNNNKFNTQQQNYPELYWKIGTNFIPEQYQSMEIEFKYQLLEDERLDVIEWEVYRVRF